MASKLASFVVLPLRLLTTWVQFKLTSACLHCINIIIPTFLFPIQTTYILGLLHPDYISYPYLSFPCSPKAGRSITIVSSNLHRPISFSHPFSEGYPSVNIFPGVLVTTWANSSGLAVLFCGPCPRSQAHDAGQY